MKRQKTLFIDEILIFLTFQVEINNNIDEIHI